MKMPLTTFLVVRYRKWKVINQSDREEEGMVRQKSVSEYGFERDLGPISLSKENKINQNTIRRRRKETDWGELWFLSCFLLGFRRENRFLPFSLSNVLFYTYFSFFLKKVFQASATIFYVYWFLVLSQHYRTIRYTCHEFCFGQFLLRHKLPAKINKKDSYRFYESFQTVLPLDDSNLVRRNCWSDTSKLAFKI